jgi:hypothetical protein
VVEAASDLGFDELFELFGEGDIHGCSVRGHVKECQYLLFGVARPQCDASSILIVAVKHKKLFADSRTPRCVRRHFAVCEESARSVLCMFLERLFLVEAIVCAVRG